MTHDPQGTQQNPSALRTTGAILEWMLVVVLLGITMLNVQPAVAMMIGAVITVTIATIILLRLRKRNKMPSRLSIRTMTSGHRRYWPEHPRQ
jgi:ABC-type cobalamin transport system permease subunit